ncbi:MAG TPA: sigma factor [Candidatus Limnocylindrales bacterium]
MTPHLEVVDAAGAHHTAAADSVVVAAWADYHQEVFAFLVRTARDVAVAEDLLQETFLRLTREARAGRTPDNVRAWLYRVGANLAVLRACRLDVSRRHLVVPGHGRAEHARRAEGGVGNGGWVCRRGCGDLRVQPAAIPGGCTAIVLTSGDGLAWAQQPIAQAGDLSTVTRVNGRWFATSPDGPENLWASADGTTWAPPLVSGGPVTANGSGGITGWHFAATSDVAVCLGPAGESGDPSAWVSRR